MLPPAGVAKGIMVLGSAVDSDRAHWVYRSDTRKVAASEAEIAVVRRAPSAPRRFVNHPAANHSQHHFRLARLVGRDFK